MHDPNQHTDELLAQNTETPHHDAPKTDGDAPAPKAGEGEKPDASKVFTSLFSELGDHRDITWGGKELLHLPVILFDDGLKVYPNVEEMQKAGQFVFEHHHIYKAGTVTEDKSGHPTGKAPLLDFSVTSVVFYQWVAMAILMVILLPMARGYKKRGNRPPKGFFNAVEALIVYVRDEIVKPNLGHRTDSAMPVFLTFFFFIFTMNVIGYIPGAHVATSSINVTAGLAIAAFAVIQYMSVRHNFKTWIKHLFTGGAPVWLCFIMFPIEFIGLFTKPFALCVRLFANMTAGHVILYSFIGLAFLATAYYPVTWGFSLFINILELLVVFLQAYVFTTLTAVFTGMGVASHDDHH